MFKSVLWGLVLGGLAGLLVVAVVYFPLLGHGFHASELKDGLRLLVPPGLVGGLALGIAAGRVRVHRQLWLLGIAYALYPVLAVGTVLVWGGTFAWISLFVGLFMAVAYFPLVVVPVGAGTLLLERLTRA